MRIGYLIFLVLQSEKELEYLRKYDKIIHMKTFPVTIPEIGLMFIKFFIFKGD